MVNIPISKANVQLALAELDFTHDYTKVKIGSIFIDRYGKFYTIDKIEKDECGRLTYWSRRQQLVTQYNGAHNMLTKRPFFAYQFKVD